MAVPRRCQGVRFYEAGYEDEGDPASYVRQIWSVNSKSGGSYVSIHTGKSAPFVVPAKGEGDKTDGNGNEDGLTVSARGQGDRTDVVTTINFVKYHAKSTLTSTAGQKKTIQPWFYLKFPNPQNEKGHELTVIASQDGVTASDKTNDDALFQVFALYSPNDSYVVIESYNLNKKKEKLYLSSDGAGNMKLKVWNAPIPGPPHTTDEVDPALLFRMVRPLGQKF